jgi:hypothetical protein
VLIVRWRCRASEIIDLIHLEAKWLGHIVPHKLEVGTTEQVGYVLFPSCEEIIEANNFVAFIEQALAKVRS